MSDALKKKKIKKVDFFSGPIERADRDALWGVGPDRDALRGVAVLALYGAPGRVATPYGAPAQITALYGAPMLKKSTV